MIIHKYENYQLTKEGQDFFIRNPKNPAETQYFGQDFYTAADSMRMFEQDQGSCSYMIPKQQKKKPFSFFG